MFYMMVMVGDLCLDIHKWLYFAISIQKMNVLTNKYRWKFTDIAVMKPISHFGINDLSYEEIKHFWMD